MDDTRIKHRDDLLQNLISGMNQHNNTMLSNLEGVLYEDHLQVVTADLLTMLDWLINDVYWTNDADWRNANRAEVRTYCAVAAQAMTCAEESRRVYAMYDALRSVHVWMKGYL